MNRMQRKINKAIYQERLKTLELVEEFVADVEGDAARALDALHDLRNILEGELVETAEALGLVTASRLITKDGVIDLAATPTHWKPGYSTRAIN